MVLGLWCGWLTTLGAAAAPERCNGLDDDGDGLVDEGPVAWGLDADGDGVGNVAALSLTPSCADAPPGSAALLGDCDDGAATIYFGADELCNGLDDDCDGLVDEGGICPCDGFTGAGSTWLACTTDLEWDEAQEACRELGYHLASIEDSETVELLASVMGTWQRDFWVGLNDRDEEGSFVWEDGTQSDFEDWGEDEPSNGLLGYGILEEDCVELDVGEAGRWNDQLCSADDAYLCEIECVARAWFPDRDGDGLGDGSEGTLACTPAAGLVPNAADCDDGDASLPGLFYVDADGDGAPGTPIVACEGDRTPTDCDDSDSTIGSCDGAVPGLGADEGDGLSSPPDPRYGFGCGVGGAGASWWVGLGGLGLLRRRSARRPAPAPPAA